MSVTATAGRIKGLLIENKEFLSASMLAVVADVPQTRLAAALRGAYYLGPTEEAELLTLANRCVHVIKAILPLRLAAGDGHTLALLVNNGRDVEEIRAIAMLLLEPNQ